MGNLPADLLADITDMLEEEEEEFGDDEEDVYQFSRLVEDVNDELFDELMDVYNNYDNMPYQELVVCNHLLKLCFCSCNYV